MNTILIAQIGENHYRRWNICRSMVDQIAAHGSGATIARFQTCTADQFGNGRAWHEWFKGV